MIFVRTRQNKWWLNMAVIASDQFESSVTTHLEWEICQAAFSFLLCKHGTMSPPLWFWF